MSKPTPAIKLHRCPAVWAKSKSHPCWRVQSALDEAGVPYEIVKEPLLRRRRKAVIVGTRQRLVPAIEHKDGWWYRKESAEMAADIRGGLLGEQVPNHGTCASVSIR